MSNETTDLINTVYEKLVSLLNLGSTADPSIVMQMAWPGYALRPSDFRRSAAPNGPYDADAARETTSHLANIAPAFNRARFENSGFEIDDLYEIVLRSALPVGATPDTVSANPIYRLFLDAQYELQQARRGTHNDPNLFYCPVNATPNTWYDESATEGWAEVSLDSSQLKPATAASSALVRSGTLDQVMSSVWRLKPLATDAIRLKKDLVSMLPLPKPLGQTAPPSPVAISRTLNPEVLPRAVVKVDPAGAPGLFLRKAAPLQVVNRRGLDLARIDLMKRDLGYSRLVDRVALRTMLDRALPTKPPSPQTRGFRVTFKFCRVTLDRPWFKLALLTAPNWWMFDTPIGTYSSGDPSTNEGLFPYVTTSFIAIRDLTITAAWSANDRATLGSAASLGCFDLREASLNKDTIAVNGLQVIAFVSKLMPRLPPQAPQVP
jgi:hypothetical protein